MSVKSDATLAAGYPMDQTFLGRITTTSAGVIALASDSGNSLDLSTFTGGITLGAIGSHTLSGATLTPSGSTYALGGTGALTVSTSLTDPTSGTYSLTASPTGAGSVILSGTNSYTGGTTVNSGTVQFNSSSAITGSVLVNTGAVAAAGYPIDQTFLGHISSSSTGAIALAADSSNPLDFTTFPDLPLGATNSSTYSGTLTPGSTGYHFGGAAGTLTVSSTLSGTSTPLSVSGPGTLVLAASNSYTGDTTINPSSALQLGNGTATGAIAGDITNNGTLDINVPASTIQTFTNTLSGTGSLTKDGSGTLTMSNFNPTFTGLTQIKAGTLTIGSSDALKGSTLDYQASFNGTLSGALSFDSQTAVSLGGLQGNKNLALTSSLGAVALTVGYNNANSTYSAALSGSGSLIKEGAGILALSGTNSYTGGTAIHSGVIKFNSTAAMAGTGRNVVLSDGAIAAAGFAMNSTFLGRITTSPSVTSFGVVALTTPTTNALDFSNTALAKVSLAALGSTFNYSASLTPNATTGYLLGGAAGTLTISSALTNHPSATPLTVVGPGTIVLSSTSNSFTGPITVQSAGILSFSSPSNLGTGTLAPTLDGGTLRFTDSSAILSHGLSLGSSGGTLDIVTSTGTLTVNSSISGSGPFNKIGSGSLILIGSNSYTGDTTITGGTLSASGGSAIPDASNVSVASTATLEITSTETIGTLAGAGSVALNANTLTTDGNAANSFSGVISGSGGSLAKSGTGTLILTGTNTYTGGTTLYSGTLLANNTIGSAAGTGSVTLNGGTLGGSGTISGTLTAGSGAHAINPGSGGANSVGTLTMGGLTTSSDTTLAFDLTSPESGSTPSVNDLLNVTGTNAFTLNGGTLSITSNPIGVSSLGYYRAIQYAGSIQGTGIGSNIVYPSYSSHNIAYTLYQRATGYIDIHRGYIGDGNDDGMIDLTDLNMVLNNFGPSGYTWTDGDVDGSGDGAIDLGDLNAVLNNFGNPFCPPPEEMMAMGFDSEDLTPWIDHLLDMVADDGATIDETELSGLRAYAETIPGYPGSEDDAIALSVQMVPEPGGSMLLLALGVGFFGRRRRFRA